MMSVYRLILVILVLLAYTKAQICLYRGNDEICVGKSQIVNESAEIVEEFVPMYEKANGRMKVVTLLLDKDKNIRLIKFSLQEHLLDTTTVYNASMEETRSRRRNEIRSYYQPCTISSSNVAIRMYMTDECYNATDYGTFEINIKGTYIGINYGDPQKYIFNHYVKNEKEKAYWCIFNMLNSSLGRSERDDSCLDLLTVEDRRFSIPCFRNRYEDGIERNGCQKSKMTPFMQRGTEERLCVFRLKWNALPNGSCPRELANYEVEWINDVTTDNMNTGCKYLENISTFECYGHQMYNIGNILKTANTTNCSREFAKILENATDMDIGSLPLTKCRIGYIDSARMKDVKYFQRSLGYCSWIITFDFVVSSDSSQSSMAHLDIKLGHYLPSFDDFADTVSRCVLYSHTTIICVCHGDQCNEDDYDLLILLEDSYLNIDPKVTTPFSRDSMLSSGVIQYYVYHMLNGRTYNNQAIRCVHGGLAIYDHCAFNVYYNRTDPSIVVYYSRYNSIHKPVSSNAVSLSYLKVKCSIDYCNTSDKILRFLLRTEKQKFVMKPYTLKTRTIMEAGWEYSYELISTRVD